MKDLFKITLVISSVHYNIIVEKIGGVEKEDRYIFREKDGFRENKVVLKSELMNIEVYLRDVLRAKDSSSGTMGYILYCTEDQIKEGVEKIEEHTLKSIESFLSQANALRKMHRKGYSLFKADYGKTAYRAKLEEI